MATQQRIIRIQAEAPRKPAAGAPCNGCGVCCLDQPCPLGILLSGRFKGPCSVLRWDAGQSCYRCGAITSAPAAVRRWLPWASPRWVRRLGWGVARLAARWVAAGQGCDCDLAID